MVRMLIKKIKVIILLAMMFVFNNILFIQAQNNNIQFKDITIEDGLSQSTVEVLYQDSYGYIWIGTNDGLDRYDGYEFKTYKQGDDPSTNIASNYILSIKEDKYKNIWVGTVNGISKINTKENIVTNYFDSNDNGNLSNYNVCDILITKDEEILVATGDGLNLYNYKTDKFERILKGEKTLTSQDIYSMDQDEYGNIWLGTYNGLNKIDIKNNDIKHFYNSSEDENTISENNIYKVYSDKDGNIWVGTFNSGVNKIDIKTGEISRYKNIEGNEDSLPGNFVKSMLRDNKDNMWIATDMGLAKYIEESETFITYNNDLSDRYSLLNDSVFSIMQDMTGLIWIGTYQGISIFDPQNTIEHYKQNPSEKNSLSSNVIHGIYEDESELLWVGTSSDGLNVIDRKNNKIEYITKQDGLSNNSINVIVGDEKYVWVATNEGLNRIDKLTKDIKQYGMNEKLNSFKIKSLYIDSNGLLWVGTDSGINIINIENDEVIDITYVLDDNFIKDKYISDIYEDKKGNYWIGTFKDGGLVKLDTKNNSVKNYRKNDKDKSTISSNSIRTIAEDDQYLWIGTSNGLNKLDKQSEKFTRYTEKDGLNSNTIYGIIVDDDGNPWMSTNHGVSKLDIDKSIFVNYNITDGFQSNEFNGGSHYKNDKGEFFFGGINGFNIFDPLKMDVSSHSSLKVSFDEFIVNGEHHKDINNMKFKQDGNSIIIKFFLPEYKNGNNIYYYKIEGQDKQWNVTKNNEIVYKNLKPGKYTFKIKAINSNGQTSEENSTTFTIKPYIFLSPIAFLFYLIIIIFGIYLNRMKMKRLDVLVDKKTNQLREEMEKNNSLLNKVIKLEKNKNNYFVNLSHELRTPLNVISTTQQLILELNKKEQGLDKERLNYHTEVMKNNTDRLLNLINNIIDTSKIEHGSYEINIKEYDIVYIVEETSLALKDYVESKNIDLIIDPDVEEKVIQCDRHEIERCIVNLISNAKKFTKEGGTIEVKLKDLGDYVKISVEDTGIGIPKDRQKDIFKRFNQVIDNNSEQKCGSGLGLTITKHIIDRHKGEFYVESEENKGSIFTIVLPTKIN